MTQKLQRVIAALGDFQVGVVARREFNSLGRWQKIGEGLSRPRQSGVHRGHHILVGLRAGDRQHRGMGPPDLCFLDAQTAGDDDPAVFLQGLSDGVQGLLDRGIDKTAGVDHDQVRGVEPGRHGVALGPQLGQNTLGIHQGLRAAQADETDCGFGHVLQWMRRASSPR